MSGRNLQSQCHLFEPPPSFTLYNWGTCIIRFPSKLVSLLSLQSWAFVGWWLFVSYAILSLSELIVNHDHHWLVFSFHTAKIKPHSSVTSSTKGPLILQRSRNFFQMSKEDLYAREASDNASDNASDPRRKSAQLQLVVRQSGLQQSLQANSAHQKPTQSQIPYSEICDLVLIALA